MTDDLMNIRYLRKTGGHPAENLVRLAVEEQYERGFRDVEIDIAGTAWDYEALWIQVGGRAVAVLQFQREDWARRIKTAWSYTMPGYRKQGLNTRLFEALKKIAERDGYSHIDRYTHPQNAAMLKAFEKQGGFVNTVGYRFRVEDNLGSINDRYEAP